jgi:hypothetical protein
MNGLSVEFLENCLWYSTVIGTSFMRNPNALALIKVSVLKVNPLSVMLIARKTSAL